MHSKENVDLGYGEIPAGQTIFSYPKSGNDFEDKTAMLQVLNCVCDRGEGLSDVNKILAFLYGPKFVPISSTYSGRVPGPDATSYFKMVPLIEPFRQITRSVVAEMDEKYMRYFEGAYISTIPTTDNMYALQKKICGGDYLLRCNMKVLFAVQSILISEFKTKEWPVVMTVHPEMAHWHTFNPTSGRGFRNLNLGPNVRNKRDEFIFSAKEVENYIYSVLDGSVQSQLSIRPFVHTYCVKAEVRGVDDPKGKVRLTSMINNSADCISRFLTTPFMAGFTKWKGCLIGTSIWKSLVFYSQYGLNHPTYNEYREDMRRGTGVIPIDDTFYITLDISSQDWSFTPLTLLMITLFRIYYCDFEDEQEQRAFAEIFAVETAYVNAKVVQWFSGYYYIFLGVMASGYLGTSHMDTLMTIMTIYLSFVHILLDMKWSIKEFLREFHSIYYGDDSILCLPRKYLPLVTTGGDYPDLLADRARQFGVVLKPGETTIFLPTADHVDRFFTHIYEDEIVSPGIHILQRYFVKYDAIMRPLHPDAKDYAYILPWRGTTAYVTKMALDAYGYRGRVSEESGHHETVIQWYLKSFGLLMDAGPNFVAHCFIKKAMQRFSIAFPGVARGAATCEVKTPLRDILQRLTNECKELENMIEDIANHDDQTTYYWVCSAMGLRPAVPDIKFPLYRKSHIEGFFSVAPKARAYEVDGKIINVRQSY